MNSRPQENSVRSLASIYTVVIGVSVSLGIASVIDVKEGLRSVTLSSLLLFLAFMFTLLPFCHGALRYLDSAYFDNSKHIRPGALVFDFVLLFFHALAFVVLALLLKNPGHFAWVLVVVLAIDIVWGIFAHFSGSSGESVAASGRWAIINGVFVAVAVAGLVSANVGLGTLIDPIKVSVAVVCGSTVRTLVDYVWCADFYFPNKQEVVHDGGKRPDRVGNQYRKHF